MNWHKKHRASMGTTHKAADWVVKWTGSITSILLHTALFIWWFMHGLDVSLLTNVVSLEAIYLSIFILISSNMGSERDRHQAEEDYRVNRESEQRIETMQQHLHDIEDKKLDKILVLTKEIHSAKSKKRAKV